MIWRWTDRVALGCFLTSVVALIGFNLLPLESHRWSGEWQVSWGWEIWKGWWDGATSFPDIDWTGIETVAWAGIQLIVILVLGSPFVIRALVSHRLPWWTVCIASGVSFLMIDGYLLWYELVEADPRYEKSGPGMWCLFACPLLHFVGVLFLRKRVGGVMEGDVLEETTGD